MKIYFFRRLFNMNKGVKRLLLVIGIVASVVVAPFYWGNDFEDYFYNEEYALENLIIALIFFIIFWIIVRIIIWIIDGFNS